MNACLIIGAVPPPRGGVAVSLERKVAKLRSGGRSVEWLSPRRVFSLVIRLIMVKLQREDIDVEFHTANVVAIAIACLLRIEPQLAFYDHNYSQGFGVRNYLSRCLLVRFLRRVKKVVIVGEHLKANYLDLLPSENIERFKVETPYISLFEDKHEKAKYVVDSSIKEFVEKYPVVIVNSAWMLADDIRGEDLYGIQWSLESFLKCYGSDDQVGFLAIVGNDKGERVRRLKNFSADFNNVLVITGEHNLCSVLYSENSILLRTTSTDGDSLSVREAIELGRPVIASDVVARPEGAIKYEYGSRNAFEQILVSEVGKQLHRGGRL